MESSSDLLKLTSEIITAHVSKTAVEAAALPGLIEEVYQALARAGTAPPEVIAAPAVPVRKSVFADYLICLEDGKKLKMLKRHLQASYGLTPNAYRQKWSLPPDYPMVAPNYSTRRSELAKELGLGHISKAARLAQPVMTAALRKKMMLRTKRQARA